MQWRVLGLFLLMGLALQLPLATHAGEAPRQSLQEASTIAGLMPPVDAFALVANDPAHIEWLDSVIWRITAELPEDFAAPITFRELVNQAIAPNSNLDITALMTTMLGDHVAIGIDQLDILLSQETMSLSPLVIYAVAPIRNRLLLEAMLSVSGFLNAAERTTQGGYSTYTMAENNSALAIGDEYLYLVIGSTNLPLDLTETLADDPAFIAALEELPLPDYGAILFGGAGEMARHLATDPAIQEIMAAFGLDVPTLGPIAAGIQIVEDQVILVDLAQIRSPSTLIQNQPVNPDFAHHIPGDSDIFIHSTNINLLLSTVSGAIASISASDTPQDVYRQIENLIHLLLNLDLATDILPWAGGDYGLFATYDTGVSPSLQAGAILEIADPAGAETLIAAIARAVRQYAASVDVRETEIVLPSGESRAVIAFEMSSSSLGASEFVLGHNDDILFIAPYALAVDLLDGGTTLNETSAYQAIRRYALPDSALHAFVNGEAPGELLVLGARLVESMRPFATEETRQSVMVIAPGVISELIESSTISATASANGSLIIRLVVTLRDN